jgi:hypothetical protein
MADFGLFIGYGPPVRGRERQAIKLFDEVAEFCSGLQERGEIESYEPVFVEPHGGDLAGFILLRGERDKLARIRATDEFSRLLVRAGLVADNVGVLNAGLAGRVATQMPIYAQQVEDLG